MKSWKAFCASVAVGLMTAGPAWATTYDFRSLAPSIVSASEWTYSVDGLALTVTSTGSDEGPDNKIHRNGNGLGVDSGPNDQDPRQDPGNNSLAGDETLKFDFSPQAVILVESIIFETGIGAETFRITDSGGTVLEGVADCTPGNCNGFVTFDLLASGLSGTHFTFQVIGSSVDRNPNGQGGVGVRIAQLSVVPLPPAILGVISAFALAFGIRRAARRAAA